MKKTIGIAVAMSALAVCANTPPAITNVRASQREGTKLVDIYYDAADADNDLLKVRIEISDNDGAKYSVPAFSPTGDIGEGITPGTGKHSRTYGHNGYDNCPRIGFRVCRRHGVTEDTTGE